MIAGRSYKPESPAESCIDFRPITVNSSRSGPTSSHVFICSARLFGRRPFLCRAAHHRLGSEHAFDQVL